MATVGDARDYLSKLGGPRFYLGNALQTEENLGDDLGIYAGRETNYQERAKLLLEQVQGTSRDSREVIVSPHGMEALIGAGAQIIYLNATVPAGCNESLVVYEGRQFGSGASEPIPFVINPSLKE